MVALAGSSRFSVIVPEELGVMKVLEAISSETILALRMRRLVELWRSYDPPLGAVYDVENLEFDPIKINQELCAFFETLLRDRVNQACRAITLVFGTGTDLDAIASRYPGGVPRQEGETDDRYRRRVWLSPNWLSPHGTAEAYVGWALAADPTLHDATAVTIEGTGKVFITLMAESGSVAGMTWRRNNDVQTGLFISTTAEPVINPTPTLQQIIDVRHYVLEPGRRGLTDEIITYRPKITHTEYKARIWLFPNVSETIAVTAIENAIAALIEKQRWLGYDHSRMAFDAALAQAGVHHAIIDEPFKDVVLADARGFVQVDRIRISMGGRAE
jgi:phage-related baseplate assembly protein